VLLIVDYLLPYLVLTLLLVAHHSLSVCLSASLFWVQSVRHAIPPSVYRITDQHYLMKDVMGGNYHVPMDLTFKRVLENGCGAGDWTLVSNLLFFPPNPSPPSFLLNCYSISLSWIGLHNALTLTRCVAQNKCLAPSLPLSLFMYITPALLCHHGALEQFLFSFRDLCGFGATIDM
jgi:hypothetical protein